jgi:hypothetical protein
VRREKLRFSPRLFHIFTILTGSSKQIVDTHISYGALCAPSVGPPLAGEAPFEPLQEEDVARSRRHPIILLTQGPGDMLWPLLMYEHCLYHQ